MRLYCLPALSDNYIWVIADADGNAVAVDPGEDAPVETALRQHDLHLRAILLTHHHPDHIGAAPVLRARHGAIVYAPADPRIEEADHRVGDGDRIHIKSPATGFEVLAVPGHTTSHVAYHGEGLLFCGDTMFSLGCGKLFEGTPAQMLASLDRLTALPGDTRVCCGHEYTRTNAAFALTVMPDNRALQRRSDAVAALRAQGRPTLPSRLDEERAANPFLRVDHDDVMRWAGPELAGDRVARFAALREAKDAFRP